MDALKSRADFEAARIAIENFIAETDLQFAQKNSIDIWQGIILPAVANAGALGNLETGEFDLDELEKFTRAWAGTLAKLSARFDLGGTIMASTFITTARQFFINSVPEKYQSAIAQRFAEAGTETFSNQELTRMAELASQLDRIEIADWREKSGQIVKELARLTVDKPLDSVGEAIVFLSSPAPRFHSPLHCF